MKNKYSGKAKGKKIALIIHELTKRKLLNVEYRMRNKFYRSMSSYFEAKIGSNTSINNFLTENNEYSNSRHNKELETIENEINNIIKELKN